jgi:hypothetical protein
MAGAGKSRRRLGRCANQFAADFADGRRSGTKQDEGRRSIYAINVASHGTLGIGTERDVGGIKSPEPRQPGNRAERDGEIKRLSHVTSEIELRETQKEITP